MRVIGAWIAGFAGVVALLATSGCGGEDMVSCGEGTVRVGDTCVSDGEDGTGGTVMADAGPAGGGGGAADDGTSGGTGGGGGDGTTTADAGFGTTPPGGDGDYDGPPGCDDTTDECAEWDAALLDGLRSRQMAAGCSEELVPHDGVDVVAQRHAEYQASVDRLDPSSPDGNLFDQVADEGVRFMDAAAMFSVTRSGAEDVLTRWERNPDVAPLLTRCGYATGVGVSTSDSGATFVSVLMVNEI